MLWLHRPPYLRWIGGVALVLAAAALDLSGRATEPRPFAAVAITRGEAVTAEVIEWRDVPVGLLPSVDLVDARAGRPIAEGEPLVPSALGGDSQIPDGWWAVPMILPEGVAAGTVVRLVTLEPSATVDGIVVSVSDGGAFSAEVTGLVAVPEAMAAVVANNTLNATLTVMFTP